MTVFTFSQARQNFARLLEAASREEVQIRRRDGTSFSVKPVVSKRSPLSVPGIGRPIGRNNIVKIIREIRKG